MRKQRTIPCAKCGAPRIKGGSTSRPGSVCAKCRKGEAKPGVVSCPQCGKPRQWYGRMKPESVCKQCWARKMSKRTWKMPHTPAEDKALGNAGSSWWLAEGDFYQQARQEAPRLAKQPVWERDAKPFCYVG